MKRLLFISAFILYNLLGRTQQQSVIYDATAIMNAKYDLNALLIPRETSDGGDPFELINSLTGKRGDASVAANFVDNAVSKDVIYEILRRNAGLPDRTLPPAIMAAYATNPFLADIDTYAALSLHQDTKITSVRGYPASNLSGSVGNNLLGNLVNGTAEFLIKRAHEEISISVVAKLKVLLERHPEFLKLFPRSCAQLDNIEPYDYSKTVAAFKAAIKEDMDGFVGHISDLYDIPRYQLLNERIPALTLLFSASTLFSETEGEKSFANSLSVLAGRNFLTQNNNYASIIRLLAVVSNSLLDLKLTDPSDKPLNYIHHLYISRVTHDDPAMLAMLSRVYLGLLWQKTGGISFVTSTGPQTVEQLLRRWDGGTIQNAISIVDNAVKLLHTADEGLKEVKKWEQDSRQITGENQMNVKRFTYYATLVTGALDLIALYQDPGQVAITARLQEIKEYLPQFTTSVGSMIKNIREEEYNLAISTFEESLTILSNYLSTVEKNKAMASTLSEDVKRSLDGDIATVSGQIAATDAAITAIVNTGNAFVNRENDARRQELNAKKAKLEQTLDQLNSQKKNKKSVVFRLSKVIKYVNLLAAISKAENSAAVEKLLETYALPAGSSRIKKVTPFNVAINAYVGGFFGRSGSDGSGFTNQYGFSAPIGCTFSTGFYEVGSASLFLSVFDIGATIRYKLDNQGKYQQNISLAGIVSPGIHAVYGFPFYLPISVGAGCQWITPVSANSNNINLKPSFNAFLAIDIPLFNLTRSK